ncbi:MAG: cupin domain-containing protein [Spirochaetaceae bacterium]|nr:MAG: cupin domain-containing protein [Spirochaetaceae bacterium]
MAEKEKKVTSIPKWIGKHPFLPGEKKAAVITKEMELSTLYGFLGTQVESQIFISTDKVTLSDWTLPPGAQIDPPGLHNYGDEVYYFIEGDPVAFNPEKGEVYQLHAGDSLLIPQGTRHQIFNFTDKKIHAISVVAPRIWVEDAVGTRIPPVRNPKFYTGTQGAQ